MGLTHRFEDRICIVKVMEELSDTALPEIKEYTEPLVTHEELRGFILDFAMTEFLSSSGIGWAMALYKKLKERQLDLIICNLNEHIREIFSFTKLDSMVVIVDTLPEALRHCNK